MLISPSELLKLSAATMTILQRFAALAATAFVPSSVAAQWIVSQSASKADDSPVVTATVKARTDPSGGSLGSRPTLSIRCQEGSLDVIVHTGTWSEAARLHDRSVRYRIDAGTPVDEDWSESTASDALMASQPRELIASMLKGKRLRLEFRASNGDPAVVDFPMDGVGAVVGKIEASCPNN